MNIQGSSLLTNLRSQFVISSKICNKSYCLGCIKFGLELKPMSGLTTVTFKSNGVTAVTLESNGITHKGK